MSWRHPRPWVNPTARQWASLLATALVANMLALLSPWSYSAPPTKPLGMSYSQNQQPNEARFDQWARAARVFYPGCLGDWHGSAEQRAFRAGATHIFLSIGEDCRNERVWARWKRTVHPNARGVRFYGTYVHEADSKVAKRKITLRAWRAEYPHQARAMLAAGIRPGVILTGHSATANDRDPRDYFFKRSLQWYLGVDGYVSRRLGAGGNIDRWGRLSNMWGQKVWITETAVPRNRADKVAQVKRLRRWILRHAKGGIYWNQDGRGIGSIGLDFRLTPRVARAWFGRAT